MTRRCIPVAERLERHSVLDPDSGCLLWIKPLGTHGYPYIWHDGRTHRAHRVAYEVAKGPIPDGLTIDHLCRNRACVNPDHLEAVTLRENLLRGNTFQSANARKVECLHGHPFDAETTRVDPSGKRRCRQCERQQGYLGFLRRSARGYVRKDRPEVV